VNVKTLSVVVKKRQPTKKTVRSPSLHPQIKNKNRTKMQIIQLFSGLYIIVYF